METSKSSLTFHHRTNPPKIAAQTNFTEYQDLYEEKLDDKGKIKLVKQKEQTNLYQKIQMYKDDCDVYKIIQKAMLGDLSVLEKRQGVYADITEGPKTLQDAHQFMHQAMKDYEKLPTEIKTEFNNDVYAFAQATPEKLEKVLNKFKKSEPKQETKQEEKTE